MVAAPDDDIPVSCHEPNSYFLAISTRVVNVFYASCCRLDDAMIHLTVPDTQVLVEKTDGISKYTAFNIHVNGWYHTSVRFSQLWALAENIKQRFGLKYRGPPFPPKKLFNLNEKQLEERRLKLAKYLNGLVQHPDIVRHPTIEKWFLDAQVSSFRATSIHITLDIYLPDGERMIIKTNVDTATNAVVKLLAQALNISGEVLLSSFGLFMVRSLDDSDRNSTDVLCVRLLRNFESPYISLQQANQKSAAQGLYHRIMLRKLIWDPRIEESLLDNPEVSKLLYRQAKTDFQNGKFSAMRPDQSERLRSLERSSDHVQFLRLCHLQPSYSYEILSECVAKYPEEDTRCRIKIGRRQIVLNYGPEWSQEAVFKATRIRFWRISQVDGQHVPTIFDFEYMTGKDTFQWISLNTDQAVLLSLLFQSVGAEILHEFRNMSIEDQLALNGGGSGMSMYLEPPKRALEARVSHEGEEECSSSTRSRTSSHSGLSIKTAKSAINDDPGMADLFESFNDVFTTITDVLPIHNEAFANISNEDL